MIALVDDLSFKNSSRTMSSFTTIITFALVSAAMALPQIKPKGDITSIATDCGKIQETLKILFSRCFLKKNIFY